jgi:uncharacterized membrane protein
MKNISLKKEIVFWILLLLPFIYLSYVWNTVPETVPIHFGISGEPDGCGGKYSILIIPAISVVAYLVLLFIPAIDPKKMNYEFFRRNFFKIRLVITAFLAASAVLAIKSGIEGKLAISGKMLSASIFLLFAVLGNFMINVKPNWFVGIRTPWTLSSDTVWKKTHLVGGKLWFYGGLFCFVLSLILTPDYITFLIPAFVLTSLAITVGYSYWLYAGEQKNSK